MRPTLYLDSSVPSYWLLPERQDAIVQARHLVTRRWWTEERVRFDLFVSQIVLDELAGGKPERATERLALVDEFPLLDVDEEVEDAARFYVENLAMPSRNIRDALHFGISLSSRDGVPPDVELRPSGQRQQANAH